MSSRAGRLLTKPMQQLDMRYLLQGALIGRLLDAQPLSRSLQPGWSQAQSLVEDRYESRSPFPACQPWILDMPKADPLTNKWLSPQGLHYGSWLGLNAGM